MYLSQEAPLKLTKEEVVNLPLEYQNKFTLTLAGIDGDIGNLRKNRGRSIIIRDVYLKLWERVVSLELQCWSNSQYSRRESLEKSEFPQSLKNEDLEGTVLQIFEELNIVVDQTNVKDFHWVESRTSKKVIIKMSRRKDANKIRRVKKNLKNLNLSSCSTIITTFCSYYKILWSICKKISSNKSIHAFWITSSSIRLKIGKSGRINIITHLSVLEILEVNFFRTATRVLFMLIFFTFIYWYWLVCWVKYLFVGFDVSLVSFLPLLSRFWFLCT